MRSFRDMPIKWKLVLVIMLTSTAAMLLGGAASIIYEYVRFRQAIVEYTAGDAVIIGEASAAALAFGQTKEAEQILSVFQRRPDIVSARLFRPDDGLFAEYVRPGESPPVVLPSELIEGHRFEAGSLLLMRPVTLGEDVVGTIALRADLREPRARLRTYVGIAVVAMFGSLLVALLIGARLQRAISQPVLELAGMTRRVSAEQDFSVRAVKQSGDEIGTLIDGFNQMLGQIQARGEQLRASEERFRQMAENVREVFWMTDTEKTEMIYVSSAYEQIWGRPVGGLYAEPWSWLEAVHPDDRERVREAALSKQASGDYDEEYRIIRRDGSERWIRDRAFPVRDERGRVYRIAGIAEDITERKKAEQKLRESQQRLQAILDNATAVIYLKDRGGSYLLINRSYETLFHISREQIAGKTDYDIFPKARADAFRIHDLEVLKARRPLQFEEIAPQDDGLHTYVSVKFPLFDSAGEPYAVCGISTDITELKRAEEMREKLSVAVEQAADLVIITNHEGVIEYVNPALEALTGYTSQELIGQTPRVLKSGMHSAGFYAEFWQTILAGKVFRTEIINRKKNGELYYEDKIVVPLRDRHGNITHFVSTGRDVTERKRLEKEILEISDREQSRIGQDLHDGLCQHLVSTAFVCTLLEQKLAALALPEAADAGKIAGLVNDALTQARNIARGLHPVTLDAEGLSYALRELAINISRLFGVACRLEWPSPVFVTDNTVATHLYRIAQEAVNNAIKHSKATEIVINLAFADGTINLSVRDNGVGLPQSMEKTKGMGLEIMKYRVRMIGGALDIRQADNGGTIIACSVPQECAAQKGARP